MGINEWVGMETPELGIAQDVSEDLSEMTPLVRRFAVNHGYAAR